MDSLSQNFKTSEWHALLHTKPSAIPENFYQKNISDQLSYVLNAFLFIPTIVFVYFKHPVVYFNWALTFRVMRLSADFAAAVVATFPGVGAVCVTMATLHAGRFEPHQRVRCRTVASLGGSCQADKAASMDTGLSTGTPTVRPRVLSKTSPEICLNLFWFVSKFETINKYILNHILKYS